MVLGRVVGKAISTVKHPSLQAMRLLVVEPIGAASSDPVLTLDEMGARAGDIVVMSSDGRYAREMVHCDQSPARWWVMCIVDDPAVVLDKTEGAFRRMAERKVAETKKVVGKTPVRTPPVVGDSDGGQSKEAGNKR